MTKLNVYSTNGKVSGEISASKEVFSAEPNTHIVNETLNWLLASGRQGSACAKTRAEVSGGGKKPWKQKGTGRARIGDNRAPHWRHGGVVFPPKPRDYYFSLPIKIRKAAIRIVLSGKAEAGKIKIVEKIELPAVKTKEMAKFLKNLGVENNALVVLPKISAEIHRAASNIRGVKVTECKALNVYDILKHENLVITKDSIPVIEEAFI